MSNVTYNSWQDFSTDLARLSRLNAYMKRVLPRTMVAKSEAEFTRHLHDAMGWKRSTVNDWEV